MNFPPRRPAFLGRYEPRLEREVLAFLDDPRRPLFVYREDTTGPSWAGRRAHDAGAGHELGQGQTGAPALG